MTLFDLILILLLGGFVMFGLWFGFFHTLGSLLGTVAGSAIAGAFYLILGAFFAMLLGNPGLMNIFAFVLIFFIISRLVGFGFYILEKSFSIMTNLPFLHSIDRSLGALVGFFEGLLVIGLVLFVSVRYPVGEFYGQALQNSTLAPWFVEAASVLKPMLPRALKELQSIIGI
jgi:membrane protein required for colicin V production